MSDSNQAVITELPQSLPVFPLGSVLLLPGGKLPLNIFEPRYLAMIQSVLGGHRMIGMVHPQTDEGQPDGLYPLGCAGRIVHFEEADDGRFEILLAGVCRFSIRRERPLAPGGYREVEPDWNAFLQDLRSPADEDFDLDRTALLEAFAAVLEHRAQQLNMRAVASLSNAELVRVIAQHSPLAAIERQSLLEADTLPELAEQLRALLECARAIMAIPSAPQSRH